MPAVVREDAGVELSDGPMEVRTAQAGEMTVGFFRLPKGADLRPALKGMPGDMCQCPHWGYILKGRIRMHTPDGEEDYAAGDVVYWPPGHAPEALEDSEYVDFSPTDEFRQVLDHVKSQ
jgi:hypothetical protein